MRSLAADVSLTARPRDGAKAISEPGASLVEAAEPAHVEAWGATKLEPRISGSSGYSIRISTRRLGIFAVVPAAVIPTAVVPAAGDASRT
jgi:hypothetical protein